MTCFALLMCLLANVIQANFFLSIMSDLHFGCTCGLAAHTQWRADGASPASLGGEADCQAWSEAV